MIFITMLNILVTELSMLIIIMIIFYCYIDFSGVASKMKRSVLIDRVCVRIARKSRLKQEVHDGRVASLTQTKNAIRSTFIKQ